jgi:hypothetical protein
MSQQLQQPVGAMSVNAFAIWASIGRTTAWKEIREGRLRAVKVCNRTIVVLEDARHWLETRPALQFGQFKPSHPSHSSEGANARIK